MKTFKEFLNESNIKTIPLEKFYKTLPSKDKLIGIKCLNQDDEIVYIQDVDNGGIWAGPDADSDDGHHYKMRELRYVIE
jgi:hypothetical protein